MTDISLEEKKRLIDKALTSSEGRTMISMLMRQRIQEQIARRQSMPLCSRVLHEVLIANGKIRCPICEIRLLVRADRT